MNLQTYRIAFWTLIIMAAAVVVIMYQHATHTSGIMGMIASLNPITPEPAVSSNPAMYGLNSRASGQWTPLGPSGASIMAYNPPQTWQ